MNSSSFVHYRPIKHFFSLLFGVMLAGACEAQPQSLKDSSNNEQREQEIKERKLMLEGSDLISVVRNFQINGLRAYDSNSPVNPAKIPIVATFKDEKGNVLALNYIAIILKSCKCIIQLRSDEMFVAKNTDNMIMGSYHGKVAYISFEDVEKLNITPETKEVTFIMKIGTIAEAKKVYTNSMLHR